MFHNFQVVLYRLLFTEFNDYSRPTKGFLMGTDFLFLLKQQKTIPIYRKSREDSANMCCSNRGERPREKRQVVVLPMSACMLP
jgi:hypothetical protein